MAYTNPHEFASTQRDLPGALEFYTNTTALPNCGLKYLSGIIEDLKSYNANRDTAEDSLSESNQGLRKILNNTLGNLSVEELDKLIAGLTDLELALQKQLEQGK